LVCLKATGLPEIWKTQNSIGSCNKADNGPEFARYESLGKELNAAIYFCDPYKSYQKGAVENANHALRADLPRQTNLSNYTQEQIDGIVYKLNNRPMKCLGFKTPQEIYDENCSHKRATI
jgi:IS30 family transposase